MKRRSSSRESGVVFAGRYLSMEIYGMQLFRNFFSPNSTNARCIISSFCIAFDIKSKYLDDSIGKHWVLFSSVHRKYANRIKRKSNKCDFFSVRVQSVVWHICFCYWKQQFKNCALYVDAQRSHIVDCSNGFTFAKINTLYIYIPNAVKFAEHAKRLGLCLVAWLAQIKHHAATAATIAVVFLLYFY